ncbi:SDR family NAD(P)-dependent oxidoreductase [Paenibacillus pini]|uniref:Malonyl CoA-acyl carrier protein transacylase n=1 Tax=Paenibacillus pini JCM 16418 TaxID=1236976 RepID=W7YFS5_9BACL|nr:SDR family NAD(P)-dependent oxidoreductase [Paenibacillus pini]GAF06373.1 malonyl CoA-acyl carrier protein transacylase [Paenibacillus pini JCM 16418]
MQMVKQFILEKTANKQLSQQDAKAMLKEITTFSARKEHEDIAIIGMAGKFPGAGSIEEFWDNLQQEKTVIGDFPDSRAYEWIEALRNDSVMDFMIGKSLPEGTDVEDMVGGVGGFLKEIDKFDAPFFKISAREAKYIDPAHRMFLETAYEAIEDAGYGGDRIYGTQTGVFVGKDHATLPMYRLMTEPDPMHLTGSWPGLLSSRLSYLFNLKGPSVVYDTACSAGLVALHHACQSLRNKECEMAVIGGVQVQYMAMKEDSGPMDLGMVESDSSLVCTFDKDANGTVWSEGVISVILKPLSKALADRDPIHAVIKGSAINNDGASNGITAPNAKAQEEVIMQAWKDAEVAADTIQYVEAHGTGTSLGDPIEIKGLTNAFRQFTDRKQFCGIGSVKTNIGHSVAASGLAALVKVVMSMKHKQIPATINFHEPNPYINFPESPLYVNDVLSDWNKGDNPRRAGISSFGFSGTNAHVILEEAPEVDRQELPSTIAESIGILTISGKNEQVLKDYVKRYQDFFARNPEVDLGNACFTSNTGRGHYTHRIALMASSVAELQQQLKLLVDEGLHSREEEGIYYALHQIVSENQSTLETGAITAAELKRLSTATRSRLEQSVSSFNEDPILAADLCRNYVKGADPHWEEAHRNQHRSRVQIPGYPLERIRTWAAPKVFEQHEVSQSKKARLHPLLDRQLVDSLDQSIFESDLSIETHWMLKEHQFMGTSIIPGVTYVEWGREACSSVLGTSRLELRDIYFMTPLVITGDEVKKVQAIVKKEQGYVKFIIASKSGMDEDQWVIHSEGKAYPIEASTDRVIDMNEIRARMTIDKPIGAFNPEAKSFYLGYHWDNLVEAQTNEDESEVLLKLRLRDEYVGEMEQFHFHPSILDNAVNPMIKFLDDVYLPFAFKQFDIYGRMPETLYSYFRKKGGDTKSKATISYDITLTGTDGRIIAEIQDYSIKRMGAMEQMKFRMENQGNNHLHQTRWVSDPLPEEKETSTHSSILVLKDRNGRTDELIERFKDSNIEVIEVETGESFREISSHHYVISDQGADYEQLITAVRSIPFTQIIHAFTLTDGAPLASAGELSEHLNSGVYSLFHLTRALLAGKIGRALDLVLLTEYMDEVTGNEARIEPHNAALMGLGKVLRDEYGTIAARSIDVDNVTSLDLIRSEINTATEVSAVIYREGTRYVQEFSRLSFEDFEEAPVELKEDGIYLITGGTGGLGLEMAKYLAGKKRVRIALINRTELPPREQWEALVSEGNSKLAVKLQHILAVEQMGSEVICLAVDVADPVQMKQAIDGIHEQYGRINGIIHAAGVAGDGFIIMKEVQTFTNVLRPKLEGTWVLDQLTTEDQPDFFISFSSIASLLGGPGQGDYTAANSYLDAFTAYRNRKGLRTISINWPTWKETGMAVEYGMAHEEGLFLPITTAHAIEIMEGVLSFKVSRLLPGEVNFPAIIRSDATLPFKVSKDIMAQLDKHSRAFVNKNTAQTKKASPKDVQIKGKDSYTETETRLAQLWSAALDLEEVNVFDQFNDLGGDSILSIQLFKEMNTVYPGIMEVSDIFTYSSIVEQAKYIDSQQQQPEAVNDELLMGMLDALAQGEATIEDGMAVVASEGGTPE